MKKTNSNDPVSGFREMDTGWADGHGPLTKREYFAAMALIGVCSADDNSLMTAKEIAKYSVLYADNLIETLNEDA